MIFLIFILSITTVISFTVWMVSWSLHISMSKNENKPHDWCTFKTFKKEFNKYKKNPKLCIRQFGGDSIFLDGTSSNDIVYLCVNIIEFNGKRMILYPCSWLRYCIWKRNFVKSWFQQKDLWK